MSENPRTIRAELRDWHGDWSKKRKQLYEPLDIHFSVLRLFFDKISIYRHESLPNPYFLFFHKIYTVFSYCFLYPSKKFDERQTKARKSAS